MVHVPIPLLIAVFILGASIGALLLAIHRAASIDRIKEQFALELQRLQLEVLRDEAAQRGGSGRHDRVRRDNDRLAA